MASCWRRTYPAEVTEVEAPLRVDLLANEPGLFVVRSSSWQEPTEFGYRAGDQQYDVSVTPPS